jgi:outer membrane protein assembly factor BamB
LVFWATEPGMAYCLDEQTGEIRWKHQLDGSFFASVVAANNAVYFSNHSGTTYVIAAEPEFKLMHANKIPDRILATPALWRDRIIYRGDTSLRCIASH